MADTTLRLNLDARQARSEAARFKESLEDVADTSRRTATHMDRLEDSLEDVSGEARSSKANIDRTGTSIDGLRRASRGGAENVERLGNAFDRQGRSTRRAQRNLRGATREAQRADRTFGLLRSTLISVGAAFGVHQVIQYADAWQSATNRIQLFTSTAAETEQRLDAIFDISQRTATELGATASLYSRLALVQKDLGASSKELLEFTEGVGQALAISGADSNTARGALIQLSQAMGSGIVRAEEFNSILEGAPRIAQAVATGLYGASGSVARLRKELLEGNVTSTAFFNAFQTQLPALNEEFGSITATFGRTFQQLQNSFARFIGELDQATGISNVLKTAILFVANNLETLAKVAVLAGQGLLFAFSGTILAQIKAVTAAIKAQTLALARNPWGLLAVAISFVVSSLVLFRNEIKVTTDGVVSLGTFMRATFQVIGELIAPLIAHIRAFYSALVDGFDVGGALRPWQTFFLSIYDAVSGIGRFVVNTFARTFAKAYLFVTEGWRNFPAFFEALIVSSVNKALDNFETLVNGINRVVEGIAGLVGLDLDFGEFRIPGRLEAATEAGQGFQRQLQEIDGTDYFGEATDGVRRFFTSITDRARVLTEQEMALNNTTTAVEAQTTATTALTTAQKGDVKARRDVVAELYNEIALLRLSRTETEQETQLRELRNELSREGQELTIMEQEEVTRLLGVRNELTASIERENELKTQAMALRAELASGSEQEAAELMRLQELRQMNLLTEEEYQKAVRKTRLDFADSATGINYILLQTNKVVDNFARSFEDNFISALTDKTVTAREAFGNFAKDVAKEMLRIAIRATITRHAVEALNAALGIPTKPAPPIPTGTAASLGAAGVEQLQTGGPARAGRPYLVGEQGPELFMPSSSGTVVPNHRLGGGGQTMVTVNVTPGQGQTIDVAGEDVRDSEELGRVMGDMLGAFIEQEQQPGGRLDRNRR